MNLFTMKKNTLYYNHKYFTDRDVLDVLIAQGIKKFILDRDLHSVLDVGCGTGKMVKFLNESNFDAYGCDASNIAVMMAKKNNDKNKISLATATRLPFKENKFDLVISISVVEHITKSQVAEFLQETRKILKPGGYIFLVTPNFAAPLRLLQGKRWGPYSDPTHINFYTPTNLAETLRFNGFSQTNGTIGIPFYTISDYLFFSTPLRRIRNSFWMTAQNQPLPPNCENCHNKTRTVIAVALPNQKHYFYNECVQCKSITMSPLPKKIHQNFYTFSDSYSHGTNVNPQLHALSRIFGGKKLLELYTLWCNFLRFRTVTKIKTNGTLLDIGCGEGAFLKLFPKTVWRIWGVEINPHHAKKAQRLSGAQIYTQPVERIKLRYSFFDVVTLWHVLEHLTNPDMVLKKITRSIKSGGFLVIEVPQSQALYRKIFGRFWQLLIPPQHLYFWSRKSLTDLLHRSGYRVVKVSYLGIVSFSGASSLANWLRAKKVPSPVSISIAFVVFPLILCINFLQGNNRENLLIIAQKK